MGNPALSCTLRPPSACGHCSCGEKHEHQVVRPFATLRHRSTASYARATHRFLRLGITASDPFEAMQSTCQAALYPPTTLSALRPASLTESGGRGRWWRRAEERLPPEDSDRQREIGDDRREGRGGVRIFECPRLGNNGRRVAPAAVVGSVCGAGAGRRTFNQPPRRRAMKREAPCQGHRP